MVVKHTPGASKHLKQSITDLETKSVRVGWFDTAKYEDGTPVAYVATIHEFGSPSQNIQPRPFMRPTVAEQKGAWQSMLGRGSKRVMAGQMDVAQMLGQFGMMAAGQVAESISKVTTPQLSESTLAARQAKKKTPGVSSKPLVDTGLMIQSVSSQVEG